MDRKDYWNKEYTEYFKNLTKEAEEEEGADSKIHKLSGHDYKTPGVAAVVSIFDELEYQEGEKILDYGCGFGRFYPYFSDKGEYYGIDISQSMIDECRKNYPEAGERFTVAEGESLPFEAGFFDKVICYGCFDACYQEDALAEMLRVTKAGGRILVSGKNAHYFADDEEACVAEVNARKKGHPNYFTEVANLEGQLTEHADIVSRRYALRRGDFSKGDFVPERPERFYEWVLVMAKKDVDGPAKPSFDKFADAYSYTWKEKNGED